MKGYNINNDCSFGMSLSFFLMVPALYELFDFTGIYVLGVILIIVSGSFKFLIRLRVKKNHFTICFFVIFLLLMTLIQNSLLNQYIEKIPNSHAFLSLSVFLFCLILIIGDNNTTTQFFNGLRFLGVIVSLLLIIPATLGADHREFYSTNHGSWLTFGLTTGVAAAAWLGRLDYEFFGNSVRSRTIVFTIIALFGVVNSLGRGALLFTGFLCLALLCKIGYRKGLIGILQILPFMMIGVFIYIFLLPEFQSARLQNLWSGESDIIARGVIYSEILTQFRDFPLSGYGMGYFWPFPHNFALQFLVELGLIGLIWIFLFYLKPFIFVVHSFFKSGKSLNIMSVTYVICFLLLEFSKSHNAYNARALFIACAFLYLMLTLKEIKK